MVNLRDSEEGGHGLVFRLRGRSTLKTAVYVSRPITLCPVRERLLRRIEDEIRSLCARLLRTQDDREVRSILMDLRAALHTHVQRVRARVAEQPFVAERRINRMLEPPAGGFGKKTTS